LGFRPLPPALPPGALGALLLAVLSAVPATAAPVEANRIAEVALVSGTADANPFLEVELDAVVAQPDGTQLRMPGFWAGGNDWRFRYASDQIGTHTWQTECSDAANPGLHGVTGSIEVVASTSANSLFLHGPIRVAADQRHFEHADGTPFFWLGDTWWKGLCKRPSYQRSALASNLLPDSAPRCRDRQILPWNHGRGARLPILHPGSESTVPSPEEASRPLRQFLTGNTCSHGTRPR
jgi:hypothetical protein